METTTRGRGAQEGHEDTVMVKVTKQHCLETHAAQVSRARRN
jgi:hypothetical protein